MNGSGLARPRRTGATTMAALLPLLTANAGAEVTAPRMETIEVKGKRIEAEQAEIAVTPGGVSLLDGDLFFERQVSSLADALRYAPGIWATSDSSSDDIFISARGSNLDATDYDMNGIKLLQDGLPVTTADGNNHNRVIDPLAARYAVVARGANALAWGASTLGGAINFHSPTARDSARADLFLGGGSHDRVGGHATFARVFDQRFDGLVTVEARSVEGYRAHNRQDRVGVYANAGWQLLDRLETRLYFTWLDNDQELPGSLTRAEADADPDQASSGALGGNFQLDVRTWRIANRTSWHIDQDRSLEVGFSWEEQKLFHPIVDRILADFDGPGPAPPVEVFSLLVDTDHRDAGAMLRYRHRLADHDLLFGVNAGVNDVEGGNYRNAGGRRNGLSEHLDNDAHNVEVFVADRWSLSEQWSVVLAAQGVFAGRDVRTIDAGTGAARNPQDDYRSFNPRVGLLWSPSPEVSVFANASRLYEPPTNFELEDEAGLGDATLEAMKGTSLEIGSRGTREIGGALSVNWDVALYYAWIDDEILSMEDPLAPGTSLTTNVDDTVHAGVEALLGAELRLGRAGTIAPLLNITVNEFSFDDDPLYGDNSLPAAPDHAVRGEVLYRHANGFYAGPTFDFVSDRYADFTNTYKVDGYALLGFRAGWSDERWRVFIEARNLLDEAYIVSHGVRDVAAADADILNPGEPVSLYAGVQARF
jgi:iron complex outermembrane receptor protein